VGRNVRFFVGTVRSSARICCDASLVFLRQRRRSVSQSLAFLCELLLLLSLSVGNAPLLAEPSLMRSELRERVRSLLVTSIVW
jgi:hypothetical protein